MHTVKRRVFGTDQNGRAYLVHAAGDEITDDEARRLGLIGGKAPAKAEAEPRGLTILPDPDAPGAAAPATTGDTLPAVSAEMKLKDLKAIAEAEGIDTTGCNSRVEAYERITEARTAAPAHKLGATATVDGADVVYDETAEQWIVVETGEPFEGEVPVDGTEDDNDGDPDAAGDE